MDTVVILGASFGQLELIKECRNYGCYIIAVTPKGNYPGLELVDEVIFEDVRNVDAIYGKLKNKNIKSILFDQLDTAVITAARLSSLLGIKGMSIKIAERFTNKRLMREYAKKCGISVPQSVVIENISEVETSISSLCFPLIMKPLDSSASHGVYKVNDALEIKSHFDESQKYSTTNKVIIEEFIEGKEYVVEAFTRSFKTNNLVIGKRSYFDIPNTFIPNMTIFKDAESGKSQIEEKLKKANVNLVASMGLEFGMTHAEYIYNVEKDEVFLVEIAARGGGVCTSTKVVPSACGVNLTKLYVDEMLDKAPQDIIIKEGYSAYICFILPEGKIVDVSNQEKISSLDGIEYAHLDFCLNDRTPSIKDKYARQGPIIVKGNHEQDCLNIRDRIMHELKISVETVDGLKGIIWN